MADLRRHTDERRQTWRLGLGDAAPVVNFGPGGMLHPFGAVLVEVTDDRGTRHELELIAHSPGHGQVTGRWGAPRPLRATGYDHMAGHMNTLPSALIEDIAASCPSASPFDLHPALAVEVTGTRTHGHVREWGMALTGAPTLTFPIDGPVTPESARVTAMDDGKGTARVLIDLFGSAGRYTTRGMWTAGHAAEDFYPDYAGPITDLPHPFVTEILASCDSLPLPEPKEPTP